MDPVGFFNISVAKHQKNKGDPLETSKIFRKSLTMPKIEGDSLVSLGNVCNGKLSPWPLLSQFFSRNYRVDSSLKVTVVVKMNFVVAGHDKK